MRILKYAIKNIIRNSFLSFSSVLVIALMGFFINILLFVEFVTGSLVNNVNDRLSVSLNLRPGFGVTNSEVVSLQNDLASVVNKDDIRYVSSKDAFETLKKRDPELAKVIETDKENPLPSSVVVKNIPLSSYEAFDSVVSKYKSVLQYDNENGKKSVVDYRAQYDRIKGLANLLVSMQYGIYGVIGLFVFAVAALVYQAIGNSVFFFREEIRIIGLVGGSPAFVYGPFSFQGMIYGLSGGIIGLGTFMILAKNINFSLVSDFPIFVDRFLVSRINFFVLELAVLLLVGLLSGFLSSFRFARTSLYNAEK